MNLKETIETLDIPYLQERIKAGDGRVHFELGEVLSVRTFSLADTEFDRKLLHYWKQKGLLPFEKAKGREKYSFIEVCWFRFLNELKSLGTGIKNMQEIKTFFIDDKDFMYGVFKIKREEGELNIEHDFPGYGKVEINEERIDWLMQNQWVKFSITLMSIILAKNNACVYITSNGKIDLMMLNDLQKDPEKFVPIWVKFFSENTMTIINLTSIISSITKTQDAFKVIDDRIEIKQSATALIKKLFNDDAVTEISIRMSSEKKPLLTITKRLTYEQLNQKVNALQRKGVFMDMTLKTRDGKLQFFESKEMIKL